MRSLFLGFFVFSALVNISSAATGPGSANASPPGLLPTSVTLVQLQREIVQLTTQVTTLKTQVSTLSAQVSVLRGNIAPADLVGTYSVVDLNFALGSTNNQTNTVPGVQAAFFTSNSESIGTLTLNADSTYSLTLNDAISTLRFDITGDVQDVNKFTGEVLTGDNESPGCCLGLVVQPNVVTFAHTHLTLENDPQDFSGTWSYASGKLNLGGLTLSVAVGGRTLVNFSSANGADAFYAFRTN